MKNRGERRAREARDMPLRDTDLRRAVTEDEIRPGDPSWRLLVELQERREGEP